MLKNNNGISLISLVITIIVIIILAGISFFNGLKTPESALRSLFTDEVVSVRVAVANARAKNLIEYDDENYGFYYVSIDNAPDNFVSFSTGNITGYVVDFDLLDYVPNVRGKGLVSSGDQVTFGEDDVYIYDKNGSVYYVGGFADEDKIYYNSVTFE